MGKIDKKIVSYKVLAGAEQALEKEAPSVKIDSVHEDMTRPEILFGSTYKIKTPLSTNALYVTINDIILNVDTEHEERRPLEMFINSKDMQHYQWIVALTRIVSAVFRTGCKLDFLTEELKAIFDPNGGYIKKGGGYMPSLVAEIGYVLEAHLKALGTISTEPMPEYQKEFLDAKRAEFEALNADPAEGAGYPEKATMCYACNTKALVLLDGCATCLNCGASKCG